MYYLPYSMLNNNNYCKSDFLALFSFFSSHTLKHVYNNSCDVYTYSYSYNNMLYYELHDVYIINI